MSTPNSQLLNTVLPYSTFNSKSTQVQLNQSDGFLLSDKTQYDKMVAANVFSQNILPLTYSKRERLNATQVLPAPQVVTPGSLVLQYTVPKGYIGYIEQIVNGFLPTAANTTYANGSGQLVWHLGINFWYQYLYENITIDTGVTTQSTLGGSIQQPDLQTSSTIQLMENAVVTLTCDVTVIGIGTGNLVAALQGWIQPIA